MHTLSQENLPIEFPLSSSPHFSDSIFPDEQLAGKKYLVFYLNDEIFAVSAKQVSEIIHLPAIAPLPKVPDWLLGIINLRGEMISVVDLPKLLKKKQFTLSSKTKLVVLRSERSCSSIAFTTDKLGEIISLTDREIRYKEENAPEVLGQSSYKSNPLNLLDAEKLISSLRLN